MATDFHAGDATSQLPIVLLHGLFGASHDWRAIIDALPELTCLALDLPGHGGNRHVRVHSFAEAHRWLCDELAQRAIHRYRLVGYSLGGRLALYHASKRPRGLHGLLLENCHPGLPEKLRAARLAHDERWAARLDREPLDEVLGDWYRQPVFADLDETARQRQVVHRRDNDGPAVAAMLRATSLGRQPDLGTWLRDAGLPAWYLSGCRDRKFHHLACQLARHNRNIEHITLKGGHNLHASQPGSVARLLRKWATSDQGTIHTAPPRPEEGKDD